MNKSLFEAYTLGAIKLQNRMVMSPMTRSRATAEHLPTDLMATYYEQRSTVGLIVTEGTSPSPNGVGYARIPGLYSQAQAAAWRKITQAVHACGARIFVQLMHTGRVSHPFNMPADARIVGPSAIRLSDTMWTDQQGMQPYPIPVAMTEADINSAIEEFASSAALAIEAGFDGVELHGANGYLIDQFLNTASNQRADQWGGAIENRARFAIRVAQAVSSRIGAARTGIRLSPYGAFNDTQADADMDALYQHLASEFSKLGMAYIHIVDHHAMGAPEVPAAVKSKIRNAFSGTLILSGGYDETRATSDIKAGKGDLVAFGRPVLANPDFVHRLKNGIPLAQPDASTFYTPGEKGYTDYPSIGE